ncbi:MAG TPA: alpha-L-arabinofuranosidase C-terminal domain-containing protein [Lachnospiraceae bacterium]|nr:alpha-L-arabinofuranosidase C-terminal domain-containing protein [Lachnospiraceae bacterium]
MKKSTKILATCSLILVIIVAFVIVLSNQNSSKNRKAEEQVSEELTEQSVKDENSSTDVDKEDSEDVSQSNNFTLSINTAGKGVKISDMMYGLFFEDINFAADGGLYAEMVKNRSFEFTEEYAKDGAMHGYKQLGDCKLDVLQETPLNENNPSYLQITSSSKEEAGVINSGFLEGMTFTSGEKYCFTVYLKSEDYKGALEISLLGNRYKVVASGAIDSISKEWKKYTVELTAKETVIGGKLKLAMTGKGTVSVDMVSLFPFNTYKNRENGLRADLVEMLKELHPSFIRFPGGCIVEGNPLDNAYRWKDTIGDVAQRKQNLNLWLGTKDNPYFQSYGLGFYEYFQLCEDIGARPVPVVNVGMSCQARAGTQIGVLSTKAQLEEFIQDALDLIEFANGSADSDWGKVRAQMGHPEPFNLEYIGVGNEQWGKSYFERYTKFKEAIREEYPNIKIITTSGPASDGALYTEAWNTINSHNNDEVKFADLVDEHYYNSPEWFLTHTSRYDSYDREGTNVFLGEYAAKANTLYAALSEAAYMTGLERNSDVVKMASYAPLFGNLTSSQWEPDMIWFNNNVAFGSVNYYVQKMFSNNVGDYTVESELVQESGGKLGGASGKVGVGTWLTGAEYDDIKVVDNVTGEVLYESGFDDKDSVKEWKKTIEGNWEIAEDDGNQVYGQLNTKFPTKGAITGSASYIGDNKWTNYTYTLRAKKVSGEEGFLIPFAVSDNANFYHWNIGGWGNTLTAVEQAQGGIKTTVSDPVNVSVKTGEWYDIKIVVEDKIECYLNDRLIHTIELVSTMQVYETVSVDEETGDIILKLVNVGEEANVDITLENAEVQDKASCLVISGKKTDKNEILDKEKVAPVESEITVGKQFKYTAPAYSVTIIRCKQKK